MIGSCRRVLRKWMNAHSAPTEPTPGDSARLYTRTPRRSLAQGRRFDEGMMKICSSACVQRKAPGRACMRASCQPAEQDLARFGPTHRSVPQPGRARNRQGAPQAGSCQTAEDGSDKSGMGVPRSIETRNKIHARMALRWNETKKNTVLRIRMGRAQGRGRCWWRSPDDRDWR